MTYSDEQVARAHEMLDGYLRAGGDPACLIVAQRDYEALALREHALRALLREAVDGHYACETDNDGWHERAKAALGEESAE